MDGHPLARFAARNGLHRLNASAYNKIAIGKELSPPARHGLYRGKPLRMLMRGVIGGV